MRQKMIDAINHKETGGIPWNFEFTAPFEAKYGRANGIENMHNYLGNHMLRVKYKRNTKIDDVRERDLWGVVWEDAKDGGDVGVIRYFPMEESGLERGLQEFSFPEIKKDFALDICKRLEADEKGYFRAFSLTMLYFERAWSLRTMEGILVDMCTEEDLVFELFDRILEHHLAILDLILDYDFEAVYFGEDWGQQKGLIMGPNLWRKFIKPGMAKMFEKVKNKGKYVVLHSCGDLRDIMSELVDIGMDVYNTIQPEIYDLEELKREYGRHITLYGGISTQRFLPFASVSECKEKARWMLENIGKGGGLILSPTHAVTPDIPLENVVALADAAREYAGGHGFR